MAGARFGVSVATRAFLSDKSSDSRGLAFTFIEGNILVELEAKQQCYTSIFILTFTAHEKSFFVPLPFSSQSPMADSHNHPSAAPDAGSASEAGHHHHVLPSRGISLNIGSTNTSHGRPAAVKHM